jgi:hypothetical protein
MRFFVLLFIFSIQCFANTEIETGIIDVDYGLKSDDEILVFLESGLVTKLDQTMEKKIYNIIKREKSYLKKQKYKIIIDDRRFIKSIEEVDKNSLVPSHNKFLPLNNNVYVPTTIESMEVAKKYFREARRTSKPETQCFNRAMVWSYEWWLKHSLKSNKLLVFFSRTFIRRFNFEWWFHIAPSIHVMERDKVVEKVMDVKYSSGPISFQRWTDIFTRGKKYVCPIITKYSDYADYPYTGECYLYRTSMYTYQPADLQMSEAWNYQKDNFIFEEVKGAYLEAFDIQL